MGDEFMEGIQHKIIEGVVAGTVKGITEELGKVNGTTTTKQFMNKGEICKHIGISRPTLEKWLDNGLAYSMPTGTNYLIAVEDVIEYIKKHKTVNN